MSATAKRWRVGVGFPQNIFRDGLYIGVMFDPEDAAAVVKNGNQIDAVHELMATLKDMALVNENAETDVGGALVKASALLEELRAALEGERG